VCSPMRARADWSGTLDSGSTRVPTVRPHRAPWHSRRSNATPRTQHQRRRDKRYRTEIHRAFRPHTRGQTLLQAQVLGGGHFLAHLDDVFHGLQPAIGSHYRQGLAPLTLFPEVNCLLQFRKLFMHQFLKPV